MNKTKLTALCAKVMGYTIIDNLHVKDVNDNWVVDGSDYNPIDDANQADDLLEYVADGYQWMCEFRGYKSPAYYCEIWYVSRKYVTARAETQNLAKILCSLRASDKVTDAEINDAINEVEKLSTKAEG